MTVLSGLAHLGSGAMQGAQGAGNLLQRAQQLQQGRLALDAAQHQLQADAAAFSGLGGLGGGASGPMSMPPSTPGAAPVTPPMPGQASVPMTHPGTTAIPGPTSGPTSPPLSQQGAAPSPVPSQAGAGGFSGGQLDPTDPRAAIQTVYSVASEIKSRNPNIDPETLLLATHRVIDLSKGIAPQLRQGAQIVLQDMRNQGAMARTQANIGSRENIAGQQIQSREKIAAGHDEASIRRVEMLGQDAMARAQFNQSKISERVASGQISREKGLAYRQRMSAAQSKLGAAQRQLSSLQQSLIPEMTTDKNGNTIKNPRYAEAEDRLQAAIAEIDRVNEAAGMSAAEGRAEGTSRGPAPATLHNKPIWPAPDGNGWVYEDGTEAK